MAYNEWRPDAIPTKPQLNDEEVAISASRDFGKWEKEALLMGSFRSRVP